MLPTSGTFNFQSIQIELIIREAFEKVGISGEFIEPVKLDSAKRSIDLIFLEWMSRSVNLWTIENAYLALLPLTKQYVLDSSVSNIIQALLRTSTRQLDGTPNANEGVAANAFDGDPNTACTQATPNGFIGYFYQHLNQINFIGVTSNQDRQYKLSIDISLDGVNWLTTPLFQRPIESFKKGITIWFDVPSLTNAMGYRIRETGGSVLDIQEIYFNNNIQDVQLGNVSRDEYESYPNKYDAGRPTIYYLDRQIVPVLNLWQIPTSDFNCIRYSYKRMIQDTGTLYTNTVQIPARFYPALIWRLAWELAIKFSPEKAQMLKVESDMSFDIAAREDSESTKLSIRGDRDYYLEDY